MGVVIKIHTELSLVINKPKTNCDPQYMTSEIIHSFSVTSANIAINDISLISLKTRFFGLHFVTLM